MPNTASDINGLLDSEYQILKHGAFHMIGDDAYEPQRNNNFEFHIYFDNYNSNGEDVHLTTVDKSIDITKDEAEQTLILSTSSVGALNTQVSVIPIRYGNTEVKFAGLPTIQNATVNFNDFIGKATERIVTAWHKQVVDMKREVVGRASVYKCWKSFHLYIHQQTQPTSR